MFPLELSQVPNDEWDRIFKVNAGSPRPKTDRLERMGRPDDTSLSDGNFSMPCATWNSEMIQSGKGRLDSAATEMVDRIRPMNKVRVTLHRNKVDTCS